MRYVVLVHKDEGSAYGVIVPDVPGCYSAGDTLEEAIGNAAEAIDFHLDGQALPPARTSDEVIADPRYAEALQGAMIATVDVAGASNVPLEGRLTELIDRAAEARGVSRAELVDSVLRKALEET